MRGTFVVCTTLLFLAQQVWAKEECDFDQKTRVKKYLSLKKKYLGSYLTDKNLVLVVPQEEGVVRITIGGCVHYGVTVELETKAINRYKNEKDFFKEILFLARSYSQGDVDIDKLEDVINKRNWTQPEPKERYYFFNYESFSTFEVYERHEGQAIVIGFDYYS